MRDNGANYLQQLLQATQPGAPKKEFPYNIPTIETNVTMDPEVQKTIKVAAISLASGIAIGGIAGAVGRIVSK